MKVDSKEIQNYSLG